MPVLSPVSYAVHLFGTLQAVADVCDVYRSTVYRWEKHGNFPFAMNDRILRAAASKGLDLRELDLIRGRNVSMTAIQARHERIREGCRKRARTMVRARWGKRG